MVNGLYLKKINAENLSKITLYKNKKNIISKIGFIITNEEKKIRNDLGVDFLVQESAKYNKVL